MTIFEDSLLQCHLRTLLVVDTKDKKSYLIIKWKCLKWHEPLHILLGNSYIFIEEVTANYSKHMSFYHFLFHVIWSTNIRWCNFNMHGQGFWFVVNTASICATIRVSMRQTVEQRVFSFIAWVWLKSISWISYIVQSFWCDFG